MSVWLAFIVGAAIGVFVVSLVHMLWDMHVARRDARRRMHDRSEFASHSNVRRMKRPA